MGRGRLIIVRMTLVGMLVYDNHEGRYGEGEIDYCKDDISRDACVCAGKDA